ncbi:unnamed protein product [Ectocarpus sp. 12 AP-2014]
MHCTSGVWLGPRRIEIHLLSFIIQQQGDDQIYCEQVKLGDDSPKCGTFVFVSSLLRDSAGKNCTLSNCCVLRNPPSESKRQSVLVRFVAPHQTVVASHLPWPPVYPNTRRPLDYRKKICKTLLAPIASHIRLLAACQPWVD